MWHPTTNKNNTQLGVQGLGFFFFFFNFNNKTHKSPTFKKKEEKKRKAQWTGEFLRAQRQFRLSQQVLLHAKALCCPSAGRGDTFKAGNWSFWLDAFSCVLGQSHDGLPQEKRHWRDEKKGRGDSLQAAD